MNEVVSEGWLLDAQVHEAEQLVDPASLCFQGAIQIMPAFADWSKGGWFIQPDYYEGHALSCAALA